MSTTQYTPLVGPLTTTPPYETQRWDPIYPDRIHRRVLPRAAHLVAAANTLPLPNLVFAAGGGVIATGAYDLWQYQALTGPLASPLPVSSETSGWRGHYPDLIRRATLPTAQRLAWAMDRFDPPGAATVPETSWLGSIADFSRPRSWIVAKTQAFAMDTRWLRPPDAANFIAFRPTFPAQTGKATPRHQHTWAEPPFGVEVQVPVLSWTGWYLDPPVRRRSSAVASGTRTTAPLFVADVTNPAPSLSWQGEQPARVWPKLWSVPAVTARDAGPVFIPGVTVVPPTLSADAIYPDRLYAKARVRGPQAFTLDARWSAPTVIAAPDLAQPVYPDRIAATPQPAQHPDYRAPEFLTDVTLPAPTLSWAPEFPDQHLHALRVAEFKSYTADTVVSPRTNFKFFWVQVNRYTGPWDREPE